MIIRPILCGIIANMKPRLTFVRLAMFTLAAVFLSICVSLVFHGCMTTTDALDATRAMGFRDPKIVGSHELAPGLAGCDSHDSIGYDVEATNGQGEPVLLIVCGGFWKAPTIRVKR
jgi:hypothetical protein